MSQDATFLSDLQVFSRETITCALVYNRFFLAESMLMGVTHEDVILGDKICILYWVQTPLVMRPAVDTIHWLAKHLSPDVDICWVRLWTSLHKASMKNRYLRYIEGRKIR